MAFSMGTRLIAFLFKVYLSRSVGAEALGLFSMGLAMFNLLTMIPSSGIPLTVSRRVAEYDALGYSRRQGGIVASGLIVSFVVNLLTVGVFVLFRHGLLGLFADERAEKIVWIMLPATVTTCLYNVLRAYFMGKRRYVLYSVTELVEEALNVVAVILLLSGVIAATDGAESLAIAFTVCDALVFALIVILYFGSHGRLGKPFAPFQLVKSSTPITLMRLFTSLAATFTAIVLPNRLVDCGMTPQEATAIFGSAVGMGYPLLFAPLAITGALSVVLLPEIAQLSAKGRMDAIATKIDKALWFILLICLYCFVIFATLGKEIGTIIFADEQAGDFVAFSAGMVIPMCLSQLTNTTLNSLGKEGRCFAHSMAGLAVMVGCLYVLPRYLGVYALGVAQTAFFLVSFVLNAFALVRLKAFGFTHAKMMCLVGMGTIMIGGITLAMRYWLRNCNIWATTLLSGALATLLYALLLVVTHSVDIQIFKAYICNKRAHKAPHIV